MPQQAMQGGMGQGNVNAMGHGTPNPAAQVSAQPSAGPGQGGAATAEAANGQLQGAQQSAGMAPQPAPAPAQPGMAPPAPGAPGMAPPAPAPGFLPNSQGQQMYTPGQGPITEQVPDLNSMMGQPNCGRTSWSRGTTFEHHGTAGHDGDAS